MAKTKNYSIRFNEQDLLLAQNLSGIKKPQKLVDELVLAYVKHLKGSPIELPKDYVEFKNIGVVDGSGKTSPMLPPKKEVSQEAKNGFKGIVPTIKKSKIKDYESGNAKITDLKKLEEAIYKPKNLEELKMICPENLKGFDRSDWIREQRVKYGV